MSVCLFNCKKTDEKVNTVGPDRIKSIISASKERLDTVHVTLEELLENDPETVIYCHRSCVSTYTSKTHIGRALKRECRHERPHSEPAIRRRKSDYFEFKKHCLFCGQECVPKDTKNPSRWKEVIQCRTSDRPGMKGFKQTILDRCDERNDDYAAAVRIRVSGALGDLHAADGQYHKSCYRDFFRKTTVPSKSSVRKYSEIDMVVDAMTSNPKRIWTSVELYVICMDHVDTEDAMTRRTMIQKLNDFFGDSLLELYIPGCASLLCLREHIPYKLHKLEDDDQEDIPVRIVVNKIITEAKSVEPESNYNFRQFTKSNAIKQTSETLLSMVSQLVSKGNITRQSLSLAQSIQSHITHNYNATTLGLAAKLHHRFGSKEIVSLLHEYGYVSTYEEVIRFRASCAKYTADSGFTSQGLKKDGKPLGSWIDNYDLQIHTPNGNRETHNLVVQFTQAHDENAEDEDRPIEIPRLAKRELKTLRLSEMSGVKVRHYEGPTKPLPPDISTGTTMGTDFRELMKTDESVESSLNLDTKWLTETITNIDSMPMEWTGWMTANAREHSDVGKATHYIYGPMIDGQPSHPDTVLTALTLIEKFVRDHGKKYAHVVADMQLFKVALQIKWSNPNRWKSLVIRPGGMHTLMSFIGCVGSLMSGTGIEEILSAAFSGVGNMLNGKSWPKALRGLRMLATVLLEDTVKCGSHTFEQVQDSLESARASPMGKLWVDCLIIPVTIMHMFVRAEREGDWLLHLYALKRMVKYFFAAGHWNYARYILWHVLELKHNLPEEAMVTYELGEHVCRHNDGSYNAVWSDQFGEQTYIRYGKAKGGLVGLTLNADQVATWILCHHLCTMLSQAMDNMFEDDRDVEYDVKTHKHKEEGGKRKKLDSGDRNNLRKELALHPHPLHQKDETKVFNIVNGCIANDKVNVDEAVAIGDKMATDFTNSLPQGFYNTLHRQVVSMETMKKCVKVRDKTVYDMEKLFSRFILIADKRKISLKYVFEFEMSPVPPALFDEYGLMRKTSKSQVIKKLAVMKEYSSPLDAIIIDGNEQIYHVTWPKAATVDVFIQKFGRAIQRSAESDDRVVEAYVVFDRYFDLSIKSQERERRTVGSSYAHHKLEMQTLLPSRDAIMKNTSSKKELINQLCNNIITEKVTMVGEGHCLFGHEEADVNIISYTNLLIEQGKLNIQVNADDNDIFVLLVYFVWKWSKPDVAIQMKKFDGSLIDINTSVRELGDACGNLLAAHALTGCDTVSYPFKKGKASAITAIKKNRHIQLHVFGEVNADTKEVLSVGKDFMRLLYGSKEVVSMEDLRHKIFSRKSNMPPIKTLPPTEPALQCHILRAHLQCILWKAADQKDPPVIDVMKFGWKLESGVLQPETGIKVACAPELMKVISCGCTSEKPCARASCSCRTAGLSCTTYCKCSGDMVNCRNEFTEEEPNIESSEDEGSGDEDD